ncbi:hypothetical protein E2C01_073468 [Portunus trituberculatus]|uniref:Uncharacterized protein n=1 Tax=Portunus trituberculatus TaxID=210409 RepID=A0A5B7IAM3_PORTR|nr:hypothetical protein [Portunus trituberculatus]
MLRYYDTPSSLSCPPGFVISPYLTLSLTLEASPPLSLLYIRGDAQFKARLGIHYYYRYCELLPCLHYCGHHNYQNNNKTITKTTTATFNTTAARHFQHPHSSISSIASTSTTTTSTTTSPRS